MEESELQPKVHKTFSSHTDLVFNVCFSSDQSKLYSSGKDTKVIEMNLQNNHTEKVLSTHHAATIYGIDCSSDGVFIVSGSADETIRVTNASVASESKWGNSKIFLGHDNDVNCVKYFHNDPKQFISCSDDRTIKIWSVERQNEVSSFLGGNEGSGVIFAVDILPDNRTIASGEYKEVRIWDSISEKCVQTLEIHHNFVNSVRFHPQTFSLATGGIDKKINIIDIRTFRVLQEYKNHSGIVFSVSFHPSGKYLLSGSGDHTIKIIDLPEKKVLYTLEGHTSGVRSVQFSPDGKLFASGSYDHSVFLWNFPLGRIMSGSKMKDIDEDERVQYLVHQDLLLIDGEKDVFREQNVLEIRIDGFCTLYSYKFFL